MEAGKQLYFPFQRGGPVHHVLLSLGRFVFVLLCLTLFQSVGKMLLVLLSWLFLWWHVIVMNWFFFSFFFHWWNLSSVSCAVFIPLGYFLLCEVRLDILKNKCKNIIYGESEVCLVLSKKIEEIQETQIWLKYSQVGRNNNELHWHQLLMKWHYILITFLVMQELNMVTRFISKQLR